MIWYWFGIDLVLIWDPMIEFIMFKETAPEERE